MDGIAIKQMPVSRSESEQTALAHTIWMNETERIASFHPVEGFTEKTFVSKDYYVSFLLSLHGYRFQ